MQPKDSTQITPQRIDLLDNTITVWIIFGILGLLALITVICWIIQKKRKGTKFDDYFRIVKQPQTMFHYIFTAFFRHSLEYFAFVALPLIVGIIARINLLSLWAIWGFLITTISAFYAARADYSSSNALMEARKTYLSVINFADDMKSFIEKVKHDLDSITDVLSIKLLTVIPAFGTVGLKKYYDDMKHFGLYREFHLYLFDKIAAKQQSSLKIITHDGVQTVDWIFNILNTSAVSQNQQPKTIQQVLTDTEAHYLEQKKYARDLTGMWGTDKLLWKIWDTKKIPRLQNQPRISIPFQFLLVQHGTNKKLYFLFSGSYLYDFIFKSVDIPIDMSSLVELTKGYYVEKDEQLLNIFTKIFDGLFDPMDVLSVDKVNQVYPNKVNITFDNQTRQIDIENEYTQYEQEKSR